MDVLAVKISERATALATAPAATLPLQPLELKAAPLSQASMQPGGVPTAASAGASSIAFAFDRIRLEERATETGESGGGNTGDGVSAMVAGVTASAAARADRRLLLSNVSGYLRSGELVAIVGSSGSSKTTLLHALAGRLSTVQLTEFELTGDVFIRDRWIPIHELQLKRAGSGGASDAASGGSGGGGSSGFVIALVRQDDTLTGALTVRETLRQSGLLRLRLSESDEPRRDEIVERKVSDLLVVLGLERVADQRIGSLFQKSLSGGEKRRTSIGVELMTEPDILMLDEPTTGLDANASLHVMEVLRRLADRNANAAATTILCTIHSPSPYVFGLFDSVLTLLPGGGRTAYFGPTGQPLNRYLKKAETNGVPAAALNEPKEASAGTRAPAEWILELIHARGPAFFEKLYLNSSLRARNAKAISALRQRTAVVAAATAPKSSASVWRQFRVLARVNFLKSTREYSRYYLQVAMIGMFLLTVGAVYFRLSHDIEKVRVFSTAINWMTITAMYVPVFKVMYLLDDARLDELATHSGSYSPACYAAAEWVVALCFELVLLGPTYLMTYACQMPAPFSANAESVEAVLTVGLAFLLMYQYGSAVTTLVTLFVKSLASAVVLSQLALSITAFYFASSFIRDSEVITAWRWFRAISVPNYLGLSVVKAVFGVSANTFECTFGDGASAFLASDPVTGASACVLPQFASPFPCVSASFDTTSSGVCTVSGIDALRVVKEIDIRTASSEWNDLGVAWLLIVALRVIIVVLRYYPPAILHFHAARAVSSCCGSRADDPAFTQPTETVIIELTATPGASAGSSLPSKKPAQPSAPVVHLPNAPSLPPLLPGVPFATATAVPAATPQPVTDEKSVCALSCSGSAAVAAAAAEPIVVVFPNPTGSVAVTIASTAVPTAGTVNGADDEAVFWWKSLTYSVESGSVNTESSAATTAPVGTAAAPAAATKTTTTLLNGVSGCAKRGRVLAVLGPSGCGKSSLIDVLSGRSRAISGTTTTGQISGALAHASAARRVYVMEQDVSLTPVLTVRETFEFYAQLHNHLQPQRVVSALLEELGLTHVAEHRIGAVLNSLNGGTDVSAGGSRVRTNKVTASTGSGVATGLSGGEQRRVSLGVALLSAGAPGEVDVVCADEPTSGLDSTFAISAYRSMRSLAQQTQLPVILTLHSPSVEMFAEFDDLLLLMAGGSVAYSGPANRAMEYFTSIGLGGDATTLSQTTVPNYLLSLVDRSFDRSLFADEPLSAAGVALGSPQTATLSDSEAHTVTQRVQIRKASKMDLASNFSKSAFAFTPVIAGTSSNDALSAPALAAASVAVTKSLVASSAFRALLRRQFAQYTRSRGIYLIRAWCLLLLGVFVGTQYVRIDFTHVDALVDMSGIFVFGVMSLIFASVMAIPHWTIERRVFESDILNRQYSISGYLCAVVSAGVPFNVLLACCYAVPVYAISGLYAALSSSGHTFAVGCFLYFILLIFLVLVVFESLCATLATVFRNPIFSVTLAIVSVGVCIMFSGGLHNRSETIGWLKWMFSINPAWYAFHAMILNQLNNSVPHRTADSSVTISGSTLLASFWNINADASVSSVDVQTRYWSWFDPLVLVGFWCAIRVAQYGVLRLKWRALPFVRP